MASVYPKNFREARLGRTFAAQGKSDQARAEYEIAKGWDSEYGPIYIGFGNIDYSERRFREALEWYDKAVELAPRRTEASALYARGNARFFMGHYEAAATDYELAIEKAGPSDRSLGLYHLVLGVTLCQLDRFSEGIENIRQAQQLAEPDTNLQEAALTESENCSTRATVTPTPTPSPTVVSVSTPTPTSPASPLSTPTPFPTSPASPLSTPTPFPTAVPGVTPPEPLAPAMGREFKNPITFLWRGSLEVGQAYQVTARHIESGYVIQSELLTEQSWTTHLPDERYADWRWTVAVVQDRRIVATSSEWMFWFNPYPRPTLFPSPRSKPTPMRQPTPFPTSPSTPTPA